MEKELRDIFVGTLTRIREADDKLVVLVSDSTSTCRIAPFEKKYPHSVVNVGIAEQNLVGIAAGMSLGGMIPFTANATPFLLGRSNEQVKTDICYSETNVKLVGLNPGFAYGSLGPTHHCLDDLSSMISWGNIEVLVPCDPRETAQITDYAYKKKGPVYIRLDSFKAENIHSENYTFTPGEPVLLEKGDDLSIISTGTIVHETLKAYSVLKEKGYSIQLINLPSLQPLDKEKVARMISSTPLILTVEEHSVHGGLGDLISEIILEKNLGCRIKKWGVPAGQFAPASPREDIKKNYNLHCDGIVSISKTFLEGKTP